MKASELRIGNWVYNEDKPRQVEGTLLSGGLNEIYFWMITAFEKDVSPIPLTEQWLFDWGFEEAFAGISSTWFTEIKGIRIEIIADGEGFHTIVGAFSTWIDIEFVHTAQNLCFALTGEELIF